MAYQLPLVFVDVSKDVRVCATRIVAIMSTDTFQARETLKAERKAGTLINAAGRDKVLSAVFLDNGSVIASTFSVNSLNNKIMRAQTVNIRKKNYSEDKAITVDEDTFKDTETEDSEDSLEELEESFNL